MATDPNAPSAPPALTRPAVAGSPVARRPARHPLLRGPGGKGGAPCVRRRFLAILAADVAGYTRLTELDELGTALRVRHLHRHLLEPAARAHAGWIVNRAGDGTLMVFVDAAGALACTVAVQRALDRLGRGLPADRRLRLRVGVSVGRVLVIDGELYGRAVNVAARLMRLAEPGDVYLSEAARERAGDPPAVACEPLGERRLRGVAAPVRVYRVARGELTDPVRAGGDPGVGPGPRPPALAGVAPDALRPPLDRDTVRGPGPGPLLPGGRGARAARGQGRPTRAGAGRRGPARPDRAGVPGHRPVGR